VIFITGPRRRCDAPNDEIVLAHFVWKRRHTCLYHNNLNETTGAAAICELLRQVRVAGDAEFSDYSCTHATVRIGLAPMSSPNVSALSQHHS
jgi:hypothetical protein